MRVEDHVATCRRICKLSCIERRLSEKHQHRRDVAKRLLLGRCCSAFDMTNQGGKSLLAKEAVASWEAPVLAKYGGRHHAQWGGAVRCHKKTIKNNMVLGI